MINQWLNTKRLLFRLFVGGLGVILLISLFWVGASAYFLKAVDNTSAIRASANRVVSFMLQARRAEKDFMLRDLSRLPFYETGQSANLAKHQAAMTGLYQEISTLNILFPPEKKPVAEELKSFADTYNTKFLALAAAYRELGFRDSGLEADWRKEIIKFHEKMSGLQQPAITPKLWALRWAEEDCLSSMGTSAADKVLAQIKEIEGLVESLGTASSASTSETIKNYGLAFRKFIAVQEKIGWTEEMGLQGEMRNAVHQIDPAADKALADSVFASNRATYNLVRSNWIILGIGLSLGFTVFYFFARPIEKQLGDASLEMTAAANQLTASSEQQASGAAEQSATVTEVTTTIEELARTAATISSNCQHLSQAADATMKGMQAIHEKIASMAKRMLALGEKSQSIGNITKII